MDNNTSLATVTGGMAIARMATGVLLGALALACGRKGPPLPPIIEVPETTVGLKIHQEEREVVLTWPYPALTRGGNQLTDLQRIEVWRLEVPPGQDQVAPGPAGEELRRNLMLGRGTLVGKLEGDSLQQATRGPNLEFRDPLPPPNAEPARPVATETLAPTQATPTPAAVAAPPARATPTPTAAATPPPQVAPTPTAAATPAAQVTPTPTQGATPPSHATPNPTAAATPEVQVTPTPTTAGTPPAQVMPTPTEGAAPAAGGAAPTTLWYAVRTVRRDGTASALSNIVSYQEQTVPPPVLKLAAKAQADGIALSWAAIPGAQFVVERRNAAAGGWRDTDPFITDKNTIVDPTAKQGNTWRYRVRCLVGLTTGPVSPEVEAKYPDLYPPPPPAALYCLPEEKLVRLRWDPSPEAGVRYKVLRRQGEGKWKQLEGGTALTEYLDSAPPDGPMEFGVKAVDAAGNQSDALYCQVVLGP